MLRQRQENGVVINADDLMRVTTRRDMLRALAVGASVILLPNVLTSCDNAINPVGASGGVVGDAISFDLGTDVGIFRLLQMQEIIESAFYDALVNSTAFASFFTGLEREALADIRDTETIHREFLRNALGAQAVPDFAGQINLVTLSQVLLTRDAILSTARMLEHTGLAAWNGAGKYIQDARNLLLAGKFASVEARHASTLRDIGPPANIDVNTAFAGDDVIDASGRDVKLEGDSAIARIRALNLVNEPLNSGITVGTPASATQASPTADFFPFAP